MLTAVGRPKMLQTINAFEFDLLVIGGGITGAGIALDAVTRGLSVVLVEMQDFAAGTSSRSTKLVHGGLRYLKQFEVKMVADVGKERKIVYENAVHVTSPEWMILPFHDGGTFGPISTSAGLRLYDFLAGVKPEERRRMLSPEETLMREPLLKSKGLRGSGYYVEYRTDDARLTIEVIKKAAEKGAICLNYVKVESFVYQNGKIAGAHVVDQLTGESSTIHAKNVVNATGPWVDDVRAKDSIDNGKHLKLTKGVHVVVDQLHFPLNQAVYFDTQDGRMIFAIPRNGKTYVGTTDTFYGSNPQNPVATKEDVTYILNAIASMFPSTKLTLHHVESSWAGVRPLIYEEGKNPSEISRKDELWESKRGLLTIAGGKLTGYRKMAEIVVDYVVSQFPTSPYGPSITRNLPLSGGDIGGSERFESFVKIKAEEGLSYGFSYEEAYSLAQIYGTNVDDLFAYAPVLKNNIYGLPLSLAVKLAYAVQFELACTPADFLIRRTGDLYFNMAEVHTYKEHVCEMMNSLLGYTKEQLKNHRDELEKQIESATSFREENE
ncbi:glycerol-3-phosphate dehydrogenase/oxidase [Paenisporosarcina indica]|uniref:glycerol-3-phosphate dehydrogenase/oxidase n=1 Tax=Paenisporosarcina indica TaxID=650093 RepID=UPI00094FD278|nr:glycerol-3-phosphate dehydrogenase/oxidase [Paenisporosarcina indica]